jgi:hypothetical protein
MRNLGTSSAFLPSVPVDPGTLDRLAVIAANEGKTVPALIRQALAGYTVVWEQARMLRSQGFDLGECDDYGPWDD